jgi:hypothetical protein
LATTIANFGGIDSPLPTDTNQLANEIKILAELRRVAALNHGLFCDCDACLVRRGRPHGAEDV